MIIPTEKYGYWAVPGKKFFNKFDALVYATEHKMPLKFVYHDNVWENFDRTTLGKVPLKQLYKERAQQLRDNYDYLILYFSGGGDSNNILRTYLDNNIKLDEICVKWPKPLTEGKFYTPNPNDKNPKNTWSEWDYTIKPALEWIAKNHPNIKICVQDYIGDITKVNVGALFQKVDFVRGVGGMLFNSTVSESENFYLSKGKSVAHIYGVDKPNLVFRQDTGQMFMYFSDTMIDQAGRSESNPLGTECFYWAPEMPLLGFEMAYQLTQHYKYHKADRKFLWQWGKPSNPREATIRTQNQNDIARSVLYDNWTGTFQADKPLSAIRTDRFSWLYDKNELAGVQQHFIGNLKDRTSILNDSFLTMGIIESPKVYKPLTTDIHFITTIDTTAD